MTVEAGHGVERLNKFLAVAVAKELPFDEILGLKAEAFEACAADSRARGEYELAEAEEAAARHAWNAAATARRSDQFLDVPYRVDRSDEEIAADFKARRGADKEERE